MKVYCFQIARSPNWNYYVEAENMASAISKADAHLLSIYPDAEVVDIKLVAHDIIR